MDTGTLNVKTIFGLIAKARQITHRGFEFLVHVLSPDFRISIILGDRRHTGQRQFTILGDYLTHTAILVLAHKHDPARAALFALGDLVRQRLKHV